MSVAHRIIELPRLETRFEAFRYRRRRSQRPTPPRGWPSAAWALADSFPDVAGVVEAAARAEDHSMALQARAAALSEQIKVGWPVMLPSSMPTGFRVAGHAGQDAAVERELAELGRRWRHGPANGPAKGGGGV